MLYAQIILPEPRPVKSVLFPHFTDEKTDQEVFMTTRLGGKPWSHSILPPTPLLNYYHTHFLDKNTEAQKDKRLDQDLPAYR